MSILITNIDMPKDDEMLCINIHPDGKVRINLDLSCKNVVGTAISIPPHGKLIDVDALAKHTAKERFTAWFCGEQCILVPWKAVTDAPTIIQAEKK